jgi:hypothetical protein
MHTNTCLPTLLLKYFSMNNHWFSKSAAAAACKMLRISLVRKHRLWTNTAYNLQVQQTGNQTCLAQRSSKLAVLLQYNPADSTHAYTTPRAHIPMICRHAQAGYVRPVAYDQQSTLQYGMQAW